MSEKVRKLTKKQKAFVLHYLKDFNATKAAIRAGFSRKSAKQIGYELLNETLHVKEVIEREVSDRLRIMGDRADATIGELLNIAHFDIRKLYNKDGSMKLPHEWDDATAAAVAGMEIFEEFEGRGEERKQIGLTKKVKMLDKTKSLELLGKHQKLFGSEEKEGGTVVVILEAGTVSKPANSGTSDEEA